MQATDVIQMLKDVRQRRGLTQQEVAIQLQLDRATIAMLESGSLAPSEAMLDRIQHFVQGSGETPPHADPSGPGTNPKAVVIDLMIDGGSGNASIYRPLYDPQDESGYTINFCPYTGIRLMRSCSNCAAPFPKVIEPQTRFCANCGQKLHLSVAVSDIRLNNYWVIFRCNQWRHFVQRFNSLPAQGAVRQILESRENAITYREGKREWRIRIDWTGAHPLRDFSES